MALLRVMGMDRHRERVGGGNQIKRSGWAVRRSATRRDADAFACPWDGPAGRVLETSGLLARRAMGRPQDMILSAAAVDC
jgi:hypothetical protein